MAIRALRRIPPGPPRFGRRRLCRIACCLPLTAITLSTLAWVGCDAGPRASAQTTAGRVLIVGIDGASDRVIDPMIRAGRLPNLAGIANAGVYGPIVSSELPLLSPRIWTSVATGKDALHHGIRSWVRKTPDETKVRLNYSFDRECHAIWNILSSRNKSVGIVNWLTTYPPEVVRGVMVSSHTFPSEVGGKIFLGKMYAGAGNRKLETVKRGDDRGPVVYPKEWTERVLDERHESATLTDVSNPFLVDEIARTIEYSTTSMISWYDTDQRLASVVLEIQREERPDLTMVLFQGIDRTSHVLWAGIEDPKRYPPDKRWSPAKIEVARVAVESYYEFTDALIGELLKDTGPDDLVIVMSDHGFEAPTPDEQVGTGSHHSEASRSGVFFARGREIRKGSSTDGLTINDVTPTVLAWLGIPVGADMDGKPASFLQTPFKPPIETHDTTEILRLEGASGSDEALLKQLKALGYID